MISVVIPVRDGGSDLVQCLEAICSQQVDDDVEIVVIDSGSTDGTPARARRLGAHVHEIAPGDFNHGGTRNLGAELAHGDVLVFTSQDAFPVGDRWLATLVAPLRADADVAGVYGRQIAHHDASPPERYFLHFMFGDKARTQRIGDQTDVTIETIHFSNVNSAIPKALLRMHPFAEDLVMSEDHEWSRRMLMLGHAIVYEPRAAVLHSHRYTIASAFRRFFDSGVSVGDASGAALRRAGARYALGELQWLWTSGQVAWIPYTAVYEFAKLAGLQLGRRHRHLPPNLKRRLSTLPAYWVDEPR